MAGETTCCVSTALLSGQSWSTPAHSSLTAMHMKTLQSLQLRRALRIIYHDDDYTILLIRGRLDMLESRREQLTERFFNCSVLPETSCLHYLLPDKRDVSITGKITGRHARTLEPLKSRTVKFRHSFLHYCLNHYI